MRLGSGDPLDEIGWLAQIRQRVGEGSAGRGRGRGTHFWARRIVAGLRGCQDRLGLVVEGSVKVGQAAFWARTDLPDP